MEAKTLIFGSSRDAAQIAEQLAAEGIRVILATPGGPDESKIFEGLDTAAKGSIEVLPLAGSFFCSGSVGNFELTMTNGSEPLVRTAGSVILADDGVREANFDLYGLGASADVMALSKMVAILDDGIRTETQIADAQKIVFITGLAGESHPLVAEIVMRCALQLQQEFNRQTYIFTGNLKVAANGLEALYRQTKSAGTIYLKFTGSMPQIETSEGGGIRIAYTDEIIHEPFVLNPDLTVIDETLKPSPFSQSLARQLGIEVGPDGFAQSDNVHRATVLTNRKGVFVAGLSRGVQMDQDRQSDTGNSTQAVLRLYREPPPAPAGKGEIDPGRCVRCLTCFRSCAYGAIFVGSRVTIDPQACQMCGVCAAECPRLAITIHPPAGGSVGDRIPRMGRIKSAADFFPSITAFCCTRSANGAAQLAGCMGRPLPQGLRIVEVPCAGSVSLEHIFSAFTNGADGVLVLTCHPGNCHSGHGNTRAHQRVDQISTLMPHLGFEAERLNCKTLASNMGTEFADAVNRFEKKVAELGPSRLKSDDLVQS